MRAFELRRRTVLPAPVTEVFQFFESPNNLAAITPPSVGFQILTPDPLEMKVGAVFDYRLRAMGFPMTWRTLITDYDPPHRFVDEQIKGPYAVWRHTHLFRAAANGTEMEDVVRYVLPLGWLGLMALPVVRRELDRIFTFRAQAIARFFR